jgi:sugar lactone lactonase YvrE
MYNLVLLRRVWAVTIFILMFVGCRPDMETPPGLPDEPADPGQAITEPDAGLPPGTPDAGRVDSGEEPQAEAGSPGETGGDPEVLPRNPSGCGTLRADSSAVVGADGLAIDGDGTIYFTRSATEAGAAGHVGRLRSGAEAEPTWLPVPGGIRLAGLALDERRGRLYVLDAEAKTIHYVETAATTSPPALKTLLAGIEPAAEITLGPDGEIYYGAETDRHLYRVSPTGTKSPVTTTPIDVRLAPAALTFAADGTLLVGLAGVGPIVRLTLAGGRETGRRNHGRYHAWASGLAFDVRGRLYIATHPHTATATARVVLMVEDESTAIEVATGARFGSLAFGRGALDCKSLYAASPAGPMLRLETDTSGLTAAP